MKQVSDGLAVKIPADRFVLDSEAPEGKTSPATAEESKDTVSPPASSEGKAKKPKSEEEK